MNREKRKQLLQLKPYLDKLEMRRLMSVGGASSRFARDAGAREDSARIPARRRRPRCVRADAGRAPRAGGGPGARCPVAGAPRSTRGTPSATAGGRAWSAS